MCTWLNMRHIYITLLHTDYVHGHKLHILHHRYIHNIIVLTTSGLLFEFRHDTYMDTDGSFGSSRRKHYHYR